MSSSAVISSDILKGFQDFCYDSEVVCFEKGLSHHVVAFEKLMGPVRLKAI
jgi:hypothetical protein